MKTVSLRGILILSMLVFLPAFSGCSEHPELDARFKHVSRAVHDYCNTSASRRTADARREILQQLDAFEADLATAPAKTRNQYQNRLVNQRCFVAMAR